MAKLLQTRGSNTLKRSNLLKHSTSWSVVKASCGWAATVKTRSACYKGPKRGLSCCTCESMERDNKFKVLGPLTEIVKRSILFKYQRNSEKNLFEKTTSVIILRQIFPSKKQKLVAVIAECKGRWLMDGWWVVNKIAGIHPIDENHVKIKTAGIPSTSQK